MSAYYGVTSYAPQHVLCHRIVVQSYTRTLPNGKTIEVKGYSRDGNAAAYQELQGRRKMRADTNKAYNKKAAGQWQTVAENASRTASRVGSAARNLRPGNATAYGRSIGKNAGATARSFGDYASTRAQQLAFNAKETAWEVRETMQVGVGNFMQMVRYGAAVAGAYGEEAGKRIAKAAKTAYENGKTFVEKLLGRIGEIATNVGKAVSGVAQNIGKTATGIYENAKYQYKKYKDEHSPTPSEIVDKKLKSM